MLRAVHTMILFFSWVIFALAAEQPLANITVLKPKEFLGAKLPIQLEVILKKEQSVSFPEQLTLPDGLESAGKSILISIPWEGGTSLSKQVYYVTAMDSGNFQLLPQTIKISQKGKKDTLLFTDSCKIEFNRIKVKEIDNPMEIMAPVKVKTGISLLWLIIPSGILIASISVALVLFLRKKKKPANIIPKGQNPYQWTLLSLQDLQKTLPWNEISQTSKFDKVYNILRAYLNAEILDASLSFTTKALIHQLSTTLPKELLERLDILLSDCDSIKFAKFTATDSVQTQMLEEAISMVHEIAALSLKNGGSRV